MVLERMKEANLSGQQRTNNVRIVDAALVPTPPGAVPGSWSTWWWLPFSAFCSPWASPSSVSSSTPR